MHGQQLIYWLLPGCKENFNKYMWNVFWNTLPTLALTFHAFCAFVANSPEAFRWLVLAIFTVLLSVFPLYSHSSVFDIVYLFIILRLSWNATGGSTIKGEMEVEYVSAEALRSICLWTDGLINRRWLEQIGSAGCFSRKALKKRTCKDNTLAASVNANPSFSSAFTSDHSKSNEFVVIHPKADLFDLGGCWSKGHMII